MGSLERNLGIVDFSSAFFNCWMKQRVMKGRPGEPRSADLEACWRSCGAAEKKRATCRGKQVAHRGFLDRGRGRRLAGGKPADAGLLGVGRQEAGGAFGDQQRRVCFPDAVESRVVKQTPCRVGMARPENRHNCLPGSELQFLAGWHAREEGREVLKERLPGFVTSTSSAGAASGGVAKGGRAAKMSHLVSGTGQG